jgi:hypothetical protein
MSENYEKALDDAQQELAELEVESAKIEQRKAQLEQTIIGLKALMRVGFGAEERSLTDGIRLVLKASDKFMSAQEVLEQLRMLSPKFIPTANKLHSVVTLLNRLAKDKEILPGQTEEGRVGYAWNRIPPSIVDFLGEDGAARLSKEIMERPMPPRIRPLKPMTPGQKMHPRVRDWNKKS